ncbi:hypothetical protein OG455_05470 [Kitasatospora sp. NBC_01287]|nr:hypothetical protein [Kitasatospora sp. NBC_01287]MCX4744977.1 hypothetical protein [Kitasatospora sp. NBC_01287]
MPTASFLADLDLDLDLDHDHVEFHVADADTAAADLTVAEPRSRDTAR